MKMNPFVLLVALAFASASYADSPSSNAAKNGMKPSTINSNGGFDFKRRDKGGHNGWCKGQGHLVAPGNLASGHRNHSDCDDGGDGGDGDGGGDPVVCGPFEVYFEGVCLPMA